MRRPLALAALVLSAAALLPASPASACDVSQDPLCVAWATCPTVDRWWYVVNSVLADPPPQPVCA